MQAQAVDEEFERSPEGKKVYEISWRDSTGKQCRRVVGQKISAARAERNKELAKRGRNEPAPANLRLTLGEAADGYMTNRVADLRTSTQEAISGERICSIISTPPARGAASVSVVDCVSG